MKMTLTKDEYQVVLRQDLMAFIERCFYELNPDTEFVSNWHLEVIADELEQCRLGKTKRLIINVPPRSLKSISVSVAFVAYLLGHNPSTPIICASYAQDLADKHASDCRSIMRSLFYQELFNTRLSARNQAVGDFGTTQKGVRLATSVGGVLTGRGGDFIIIDDPLKPDEALSDVQRKNVNEWYDHTLSSRLNDKRKGCVIIIMQRLHEDDLVGHVQKSGEWKVLRFPAIAEEDEEHLIRTPYGTKQVKRLTGQALHPGREPLEILEKMRETHGEYNFAGQYQQAPAPRGGGMVKMEWFKTYCSDTRPQIDFTFQSWDTANKTTELSDYSVCLTFGFKKPNLYLLNVFRKRMGYPELKRAILEQAALFTPKTILIEDKASGTQLIQDLIYGGLHNVARYQPKMDKIMRLHSVTNTIENGFVFLPDKALWLNEYVHELTTFPNGKYDDQADSTSQALDWIKNKFQRPRTIVTALPF